MISTRNQRAMTNAMHVRLYARLSRLSVTA